MLTAVHGKLLSRQSLLHFHDQGRDGLDGVERRAREIEATFLRGTDRQNAPLLFYIPSGDIWDSGYFDKLSDSHCVMPYRFVYPPGHPGPQLSADGTTTVSSLDNVSLFVWDCNHPVSAGTPRTSALGRWDNDGEQSRQCELVRLGLQSSRCERQRAELPVGVPRG
jgi:hypothetical protein